MEVEFSAQFSREAGKRFSDAFWWPDDDWLKLGIAGEKNTLRSREHGRGFRRAASYERSRTCGFRLGDGIAVLESGA